MNNNYPLGKTVTEENYPTLRNIALKLSAKDFKETTGLGHGVHNRLRRFNTFIDYKKDEKERAIKYGYIKKQRNIKRKTVEDVYLKLEEIEKVLLKLNNKL